MSETVLHLAAERDAVIHHLQKEICGLHETVHRLTAEVRRLTEEFRGR